MAIPNPGNSTQGFVVDTFGTNPGICRHWDSLYFAAETRSAQRANDFQSKSRICLLAELSPELLV